MSLANHFRMKDNVDVYYADIANVIMNAVRGNKVESGGGLTGTATLLTVDDVHVNVAAGDVFVTGVQKTMTSLAINLYDEYLPLDGNTLERWVYVMVSSTGAVITVAGNTAAIGQAIPPDFDTLGADVVMLARIILTDGDTTVDSGDITDLRIDLPNVMAAVEMSVLGVSMADLMDLLMIGVANVGYTGNALYVGRIRGQGDDGMIITPHVESGLFLGYEIATIGTLKTFVFDISQPVNRGAFHFVATDVEFTIENALVDSFVSSIYVYEMSSTGSFQIYVDNQNADTAGVYISGGTNYGSGGGSRNGMTDRNLTGTRGLRVEIVLTTASGGILRFGAIRMKGYWTK